MPLDNTVPTLASFTFYREPLDHQRIAFERFKDERYFGLFFEQRCGKTKVALDVFRYRYERAELDALIVIAFPNGVHRVWEDEMPVDWPPEFLARVKVLGWRSGKSTSSQAARDYALSLRDHEGPIAVTMNCEAITTKHGFDYLEWILKKRRAMVVADEASWAANWTARTRKLDSLGHRKNAIVKVIADGTPAEEGPGELYHPTQFLQRGLLGYNTKVTFKARYFEYEEEEDPDRPGVMRRVVKNRHAPGGGGKVIGTYEVFKGYRNLDELEAKLKTFSMRVLRKDVSDAPEKVYQTRYFAMTDRQRKIYDDLRDTYVAELASGPYRAADVLLRMTRLQMIARNYVPPERVGVFCPACKGEGTVAGPAEEVTCDDCGGLGLVVTVTDLQRIDPDRNPAAEALGYELRRGPPAVIWCRFHQDVTDAVEASRAAGRETFRYDGTVHADEREEAYQAFRAGRGDAIVGTILSGLSRGKKLSRAGLLIYYSNEFSLRARRQSEDRAEGLEKTVSTDIVDLVAEDTRDLDVIRALRDKRAIAERIMGDSPTRWL